MDDKAVMKSYGPMESDKRYEAVVYTINGVHKAALFDALNPAHAWLEKRCEETYKGGSEYAAVIYDQHENRRQIYAVGKFFLIAGKDYH
jgi:hypothetical protein